MVSISVSAQYGIAGLRKVPSHSALSLNSLPIVALKTVWMLVRLNANHSWPWMECWPLCFSFLFPLVLWGFGLSVLRKFLKHLSTSALPSCRLGLLCLLVYLPDHSPWFWHGQGSRSTMMCSHRLCTAQCLSRLPTFNYIVCCQSVRLMAWMIFVSLFEASQWTSYATATTSHMKCWFDIKRLQQLLHGCYVLICLAYRLPSNRVQRKAGIACGFTCRTEL